MVLTGVSGEVHPDLAGTVDSDGSADLDFDAKFNRIERFVPEFPGTVAANGSAKRNKGVWTIDAQADGPAEISGKVSGTFDESTGEVSVADGGGCRRGESEDGGGGHQDRQA